MQKLNLPDYDFRLKEKDKNLFIFDELRKKFLVLTPEEWVRQNIIRYLITDKDFPEGLISTEAGIKVNTLRRRYDVLVFSKLGDPFMLVECKSTEIKLTQNVIDQVVAYNSQIKAPYILISNGMQHFFLKLNASGIFEFQPDLPNFKFL